MPIYEFYCPKNQKIYSFLARSLAYAGVTPRCPDNPKYPMERLVSGFAVTGRAKETPDAAPDGMDDPKMEAAMAQMEREFSTLDSENPDPKQLAQVMRRMSSLTGEAMPPQAEEMIRRMEAGEDPDKLDEEYGDAPDPFGGDMEGGTGDEDSGPGKVKARRRRTTRDPVLYDISEYVD